MSDYIEYVAQSDLFRELDEGEIIPEYQWFIQADGWLWCEELKGQSALRRRHPVLDMMGIKAL